MSLLISGSLEQVKAQIERLHGLEISLFTPAAKWLYFSTTGNFCPRCEPHVGQIMPGSDIPSLFPYYRWISADLIHPENHRAIGWWTPCYCRLELQNRSEVISNELQEILI